jgi:hypothetical protein
VRPPREDETEPTDEEIRAMDEAIARSSHVHEVTGQEGSTRVMFVGKEGLDKVKKALGRSDERETGKGGERGTSGTEDKAS